MEGIRLDVVDDGPGVPAADLDRIFEPFYQIDGSVTREHGGMGLGLAIVRRLAEALGGSALAESPPGEATARIQGIVKPVGGLHVMIRLPAPRQPER